MPSAPAGTQALYQRLTHSLRRLTLPTETVLLQPGQPVLHIPWVEQGRIRVTQHDDQGHELLLYYVMPQETCVLTTGAAFRQGQSLITAVAEAGTVLRLLPVEELPDVLHNGQDWMEGLLALYERRFTELVALVQQVAFASVEQRLLHTLRLQQRLTPGSALITLTHQALAQQLGTEREVISRALKALEQQGYLTRGRGTIALRPQ